MPYKNIEKQREASKLGMRRLRQRRKIQENLYKYQQDVLKHIFDYEFFIAHSPSGDVAEWGMVRKEAHDEFIERAQKFGVPLHKMKHYSVVEIPNKYSTTLVLPDDAKPIPVGKIHATKTTSFKADPRIHDEFVTKVKEQGMDICYVLNSLELAYIQGKPVQFGQNTVIVNLNLDYSVEKPRRIKVRGKKTIVETAVWLGDGKGGAWASMPARSSRHDSELGEVPH